MQLCNCAHTHTHIHKHIPMHFRDAKSLVKFARKGFVVPEINIVWDWNKDGVWRVPKKYRRPKA